MSTLCTMCNTNWCGCGGGMYCANCKKKVKQINNDPSLSAEQKKQKISELNAGNNQTQ